jgi:pimeloyl-ACP methyl ester carboxylesterase
MRTLFGVMFSLVWWFPAGTADAEEMAGLRLRLRIADLDSCATYTLILGTGLRSSEGSASADRNEPENGDCPESQLLNLDMKTLGGRQFWGDVHFFRGWRIQQNVLTGHYRLLDPDDVRRAWGTQEACRNALEEARREQQLPPMSGPAVVLVHGIVRSSKSFGPLRKRLEEEGYTVVGFEYPSTRMSIDQSAEYLRQTLNSLEGIEQIDFVVHSMGGLLVRHALNRDETSGEKLGDGPGIDPRIRRMVMMGVPNQGARMANLLQQNVLFRWIFGPAGQQLVEDPEGFIASLSTPPFEFAIIAGARGHQTGWNPLMPGDDDGTVAVESTRLPGASDFITVPALHSFIMWHPEAIDATIRFLNTGSLHADGHRDPIPCDK